MGRKYNGNTRERDISFIGKYFKKLAFRIEMFFTLCSFILHQFYFAVLIIFILPAIITARKKNLK